MEGCEMLSSASMTRDTRHQTATFQHLPTCKRGITDDAEYRALEGEGRDVAESLTERLNLDDQSLDCGFEQR